jgi:regulator of extracellular matrix RemA (YlzA/DUF370 family)
MLISIGYGHSVESGFIRTILRPDSPPVKRLRRQAAESGMLIDATSGRKARSVIVLGTNQVFLCAPSAETLQSRLRELR